MEIGKRGKEEMDVKVKTKTVQGRTKEMVLAALMAAVICVIAPISLLLPISPVPISMATLTIYITVYVLGMKRGTISCMIYLFIGLVGLPVFSSFTGGAGKLFGPTGGYLSGFVFMTIICGFFIEKYPAKRRMQLVGMLLGTLACYLFGTIWLAYQANMDFYAALLAGVIPFIPGDLVKMGIALGVGPVVRKQLKRTGLN